MTKTLKSLAAVALIGGSLVVGITVADLSRQVAKLKAEHGQLRSQLATQAAPAPLLPRLANEVRDATRKAVSLPVVSTGAAKAD
jgi:hypothetical protein